MPAMTRKQNYLAEAIERVEEVLPGPNPTEKAIEIKDKYGVLCHKFPIMMRNDGLAQTIAWVEEKSSDFRRKQNKDDVSSRAWAYTYLRNHIAATLGVDSNKLISTIQKASMPEYLRYTSTLLEAWGYHKRFAESLLDVDASKTDE